MLSALAQSSAVLRSATFGGMTSMFCCWMNWGGVFGAARKPLRMSMLTGRHQLSSSFGSCSLTNLSDVVLPQGGVGFMPEGTQTVPSTTLSGRTNCVCLPPVYRARTVYRMERQEIAVLKMLTTGLLSELHAQIPTTISGV